MNTDHMNLILKTNHLTRDCFRGVFPMDWVPSLKMEPGCYIINTDDEDEPGEHWVAVYNDNGQIEYFDSYGLPPLDKRLDSFLGNNYKYNATHLQQLFTKACGFYCVYYIFHRVMNFTMEEIITVLKRSDGDHIAQDFVTRHYKPLFN